MNRNKRFNCQQKYKRDKNTIAKQLFIPVKKLYGAENECHSSIK